MLNSKGFDEWAAGYDASVRHSHDAGEYPFAGYDAVLSLIEARVNSRPGADAVSYTHLDVYKRQVSTLPVPKS